MNRGITTICKCDDFYSKDSVSVENAFHTDPRILSCAAVGIPDGKYGEQVTVAFVAKDDAKGLIKEAEIRRQVQEQ